MVQDYQYLNSWMVKNNYLLPLISDLIDSIRKKRVFTKMDLWWDYNNMRIKEGDEWKAVFSMLERSFKPTVIFFGLTNLLLKSLMVDFIFILFFYLYFIFPFLFLFFSIFRTTRVRVYQSCCHSSHKLMVRSQD